MTVTQKNYLMTFMWSVVCLASKFWGWRHILHLSPFPFLSLFPCLQIFSCFFLRLASSWQYPCQQLWLFLSTFSKTFGLMMILNNPYLKQISRLVGNTVSRSQQEYQIMAHELIASRHGDKLGSSICFCNLHWERDGHVEANRACKVKWASATPKWVYLLFYRMPSVQPNVLCGRSPWKNYW